MEEPKLKFGESVVDLDHGYNRTFTATTAGELVTGRLIFGFKGDRSSRLFYVTADFDDEDHESFTMRHHMAEQATLPIKDEVVAAGFLATALARPGESVGPLQGRPVSYH